jgi:hypothetical protein
VLEASNVEVVMRRTKTTILLGAALLQITVGALGFPAIARAQAGHAGHASPAAPSARPGDAVTTGVNEEMAGHMEMSPHMKLTPTRPATASDSARAAQVVTELRQAIERYKDVRVAEADGYVMFAPRLPQEVYHFTSTWRSVKEAFRFDPAQPSSLLYRRTPSGNFELVGAMYHAPKRLSPEKLDARVPLSIARWHAHTNFCVPKRGEQERWLETKDGAPVFGPRGAITTREQCEAVRGKFHEQVFGWMVHAMVFDGDDPATVWGDNHGGHAGHGDHRP